MKQTFFLQMWQVPFYIFLGGGFCTAAKWCKSCSETCLFFPYGTLFISNYKPQRLKKHEQHKLWLGFEQGGNYSTYDKWVQAEAVFVQLQTYAWQ